MKKIQLFLFVIVLIIYLPAFSQVGIGTATPAASAQLDVTSNTKGFLPPRVTLTGTNDVSTITSPATGLFVYNTATAGVSPSNVTAGLYYYDGSKWQRIINQQPDATVEFNQLTPTTAGVVFTPNTPASKDYVYVSTVDNSQWTYNGSIYVTYTAPASTAWYLAGGTSDAGSNKTGAISRTGNVGVGPTTPPIYGGYTSMAISNATNGGVFDFMNGSNRVGTIFNNPNAFSIGSVGTTPNTIPLVFLAGGSSAERMRITGTGNVGIGTTTPVGKLEVIDNGASSGGNTARFYNPGLADGGLNYISIGKSSINNEAALLGFSKEATISRAWLGVTGDDIIGGLGLTVQKGGNVGIGDKSPAYRFSVFNNISGEYAARIYNGNNSGTAHGLLIRAGSNGTPFGAVMICFQNIDGSPIGSITQNASTTVAYNTSSDRRLKNNIVNTHFGINDLMKIQVRDYVYKADAGKTLTTGFIAQELYDIFPNAVTKPAKAEDMWSVDYGKVTPLLVKAIQEQQATIEAQQKQIDELKRMVEKIRKK